MGILWPPPLFGKWNPRRIRPEAAYLDMLSASFLFVGSASCALVGAPYMTRLRESHVLFRTRAIMPEMALMDLTGKTAFVAGVADSSGYGWAICKALAEAGATVTVGTWPPVLGIFEKSLRTGKLLSLRVGEWMQLLSISMPASMGSLLVRTTERAATANCTHGMCNTSPMCNISPM